MLIVDNSTSGKPQMECLIQFRPSYRHHLRYLLSDQIRLDVWLQHHRVSESPRFALHLHDLDWLRAAQENYERGFAFRKMESGKAGTALKCLCILLLLLRHRLFMLPD